MESAGYIRSFLYDSVYDLFGERHIVIMSIRTVRRMNIGPPIGSLSGESVAEAFQGPCTKNSQLDLTRINYRTP